MKEYIKILDEIKETSSRIQKEKILKDNQDNEGLKNIFRFVYDPMIVTGISKRKIEKELDLSTSKKDFDNIFQVMDFVKSNNTGTHSVLIEIQKFLSKLDEEQQHIAKSIIIKDLPIGISRTTLNKVYGKDFIKKYSVMLAGKYNKDKHDLSKGYSLSLKLDGNRVTAFNTSNGVKFFTRSGKQIEDLVELEEEFKKLPQGMVYDGELLAVNNDNLQSKDLFNKTQTIVRKKGQKRDLDMIIFDLLPIEEFEDGKSKKDYQQRMIDLDKILTNTPYLKHLKKVPIFYTGNDSSMINYYLDRVTEDGEEGLMINLLDGKYETKRSNSLLKVKEFTTLDLRCIGIKEDIRGNKCGSITVDYKGYKVDVSGLKNDDKIRFWENPDLVIGKIIEVKYKDESKNASGGLSLRHPNFIRIRDDKDEVSYV